MNDTVKVNGRTYKVEVIPPHRDLDDGRPVYRLTGKRGASYRTIRNRPHPEQMFLIRDGSFGSGAMDGVWLTDKGGALQQVR